MKWETDDKWERWFAWRKVFIPGIVGESSPKIIWLETVERKRVINEFPTSIYAPYITYEYREI